MSQFYAILCLLFWDSSSTWYSKVDIGLTWHASSINLKKCVPKGISSYQHSHARSCNTKIHQTASAEVNDPGQIHKYSHIILDEALLRVSIICSGDTYPMFRVEGLKNEWNQGILAIIRIDQLLTRSRASCSDVHNLHNPAVRTACKMWTPELYCNHFSPILRLFSQQGSVGLSLNAFSFCWFWPASSHIDWSSFIPRYPKRAFGEFMA